MMPVFEVTGEGHAALAASEPLCEHPTTLAIHALRTALQILRGDRDEADDARLEELLTAAMEQVALLNERLEETEASALARIRDVESDRHAVMGELRCAQFEIECGNRERAQLVEQRARFRDAALWLLRDNAELRFLHGDPRRQAPRGILAS